MDFLKFREQITDFIFVEDEPQKADIIFVPGNAFPQNAENAARLYREGYAPLILPSGRYSITMGHFAGVQERADLYSGNYETEWEFMKDVLMKNGVPESAILKEDQATYTWDNAVKSRQVVDALELKTGKAILSCRNVHARRSLMYYEKAFPDTLFIVCPSEIGGINRRNWYTTTEGVEAVNGEVSRIVHQFSLLM